MNAKRVVKLKFMPNCKPEQLQAVAAAMQKRGLVALLGEEKPAAMDREEATPVIGTVIGNEDHWIEELSALPGVRQIMLVASPFALSSLEFKNQPTVIDCKEVRIGGGHLAMIAGPCSVESEQQLMEIACSVRASGANILRGGVFKPRSSPYSFQGLGMEGLKILQSVGVQVGLPTITEVMDPHKIEMTARYVDIIQIGARNMQNYDLLRAAGQCRTPILLKRAMSATVKDLLLSAEYILSEGNAQVILCERGVRSFEDSTRNMLDLACVPNVHGQSHLPIIVDPSHATGRVDLIPDMARAAIAAGADGVHIEVHHRPKAALSDGEQSLMPEQYAAVMADVTLLAQHMGKTIDLASDASFYACGLERAA